MPDPVTHAVTTHQLPAVKTPKGQGPPPALVQASDATAPGRARPAPRRRFPGLLKSAALKFALLYVLLFGISALALAVTVWWQTAGLLDRQTDDAISADVQGLSEQWNEGGTPALIITIRARLEANADDMAIYLLADQSFVPITGNLSRWPIGVTMTQDWFSLPVARNKTRGLARIHRFDLPDGFHLLVGRDARVGTQLRRLLTGALLWSLLVVILLATAGAWLVRRVVRRNLAGVFATAYAISTGDLAQRVPRTGRGDEFDSLAETINDMLDRIARLMDGVKHVSDAIAHDLRTPITRAKTRLEDAAAHAQTRQDLHAAIDRAQADLDSIVSVFQALLRITEIESGARRSAFARFDLSQLLQDLAELYQPAAEDTARTLTLTTPPTAALLGDRALIQQAIANLIDNALKFSPPGSTIALTLQAARDLRIRVSDQGPGMTEPERLQAPTRFFRAEAARSTPGSGLGLSLVEAVAHLHGGTLVLEDNHPGLCAEIRLPAQGG